MAQGLRQSSASGWLTQCHQVWALGRAGSGFKAQPEGVWMPALHHTHSLGLDPDPAGATKGQR